MRAEWISDEDRRKFLDTNHEADEETKLLLLKKLLLYKTYLAILDPFDPFVLLLLPSFVVLTYCSVVLPI